MAGIVNGDRPEQGRRLLDEALRLLDLAQATRSTGARQEADVHPVPECRSCPVCRGMAYLREVDPQAVERLTGAVADVAAAVRDLLGATAPETQRSGHASTAGAGGSGGSGGSGGQDGQDGQGGVPRVRVQQIDVTD